MLKRQLNTRYNNYLKKLAIKIQEDLSKKIHDRRIIKKETIDLIKLHHPQFSLRHKKLNLDSLK
jgi:hypothetical protein